MRCELHLRPVVEAGSSQRAIVHSKPGDTDDVQRDVRRRTQASDVTRVGWNLRFDECNVQHSCHSLATTKRNDELRLKVSSFLLQGPVGLRCLCAPVEVTCCKLLVRLISSSRPSLFLRRLRPSLRLSWFRPFSRLSFHLF